MKIEIKKLNVKNKSKGITLVALVVTIIILLILSGVAVNLILGEEGIFKIAKEGAEIYKNASENEKIEIDEASNYIDDYRDMSEISKAIKRGTVYKENTIIYDKYKNPVKVPAGFKLAEDSGTDVTKGVVIEDAEAGDSNTKGNQYVWVPIGDIKYNENGDIKTINFGRYEFESTVPGRMMQSADNYASIIEIDVGYTYNYTERTSSQYGEVVAKNLGDFISKAKNSRGYYVGRYEAGKVNGNTNTFNIQKGQTVYNYITQSNAATLSKNLYGNNTNFESDLINSYAWDTAIKYIQTFSGDSEYSRQNRLQDILTTTGNAHDEENNYDVRCNIYDMAGNVAEWSTETYLSSEYPCSARGGRIERSYHNPNSRHWFSTLGNNYYLGFRSIIYV